MRHYIYCLCIYYRICNKCTTTTKCVKQQQPTNRLYRATTITTTTATTTTTPTKTIYRYHVFSFHFHLYCFLFVPHCSKIVPTAV